MKEKKFGFRTLCVVAGAFVSYTVGSGFASGNEVLQFFGSWGMPGCIFAIAGSVLITLVTCICLYYIGSHKEFEKTSDAYFYIGGKGLGAFFQLFTFVSLFGTFMIMFSGAGSVFSQQWGLPQWVGSVIMGVLSGIVVLGGLETVEKVLGYVGIILLLYVLVFGVISLFHPGTDISQVKDIPSAVETGTVMQANLFALPPLSYIPGLDSLNTPFLEGVLYAALCLVNGVPFYMALGKNTKTSGQAVGAAVFTTAAYYGCVALVLVIVISNFSRIVSGGTMAPFPVLSAVDFIWPSGSWTYVIIIFLGIFTTTTGFLWVLSEWLFPGQVRTKKTNSFIVAMIVVGITLGSVLPFSVLINFIFPISGVVGVIITVCLIIKALAVKKEADLAQLSTTREDIPDRLQA